MVTIVQYHNQETANLQSFCLRLTSFICAWICASVGLWGFITRVDSCEHHHSQLQNYPIIRHLSGSPTHSPTPPLPHSSPSSDNHESVLILRLLYKWNHTVCNLWCLAFSFFSLIMNPLRSIQAVHQLLVPFHLRVEFPLGRAVPDCLTVRPLEGIWVCSDIHVHVFV